MSADTRSALAALDAARPLVVRLDAQRHPEDAAADLIESWSHVETALRALLGGSSLAGQALVSEVRARALLDYPHAHALLGFLAARDRATRADYQPTADDIAAARAGFQALEAALGAGIGANTGMHPTIPRAAAPPAASGVLDGPVGGTGAAPTRAADLYPPRADPYAGTDEPPRYASGPRRANAGRNLAIGGAVAALLTAGGYYAWASSQRPRALDQAINDFAAGRVDAARRGFQDVAQSHPTLAAPHVYLARIARSDGDLTRAGTELEAALRADSSSAIARREVGLLMLQTGHPDRAINYFSRALDVDENDRTSMGWMACALTRRGVDSLAAKFYARAGSGDWDACRTAGAGAPGTPVPGLVPSAGTGAGATRAAPL